MARGLSLPREHGGYITLVGATLAAALHAPRPLATVGSGLALRAAFYLRGPLDRAAVGLAPARWDRSLIRRVAASEELRVDRRQTL